MADVLPKELYDQILQIVPATSDDALVSLYEEFVALDRTAYDSLSAFQTRVTYLKNRLEVLGYLPPEKGNIIVVMKAIKSTYPEWHGFLMYDFEKDTLTWKSLMKEMAKRASAELAQMSLVSLTKKSTISSASNSAGTPTEPQPTQDKPKVDRFGRVYCKDCGYYHRSNLKKWCITCKQHEGNWNWCISCKKHHGPGYTKYVANETSTPSELLPVTTELLAALKALAGALFTSTGLPGSGRLAQMAIHSDLFEKRYIDRDSVLLDSACFNHIFNDKKWFIEYQDTPMPPFLISDSNGGATPPRGKGTVRVTFLLPDKSTYTLDLPNTLYQPATPCNLISAGHLEQNAVV